MKKTLNICDRNITFYKDLTAQETDIVAAMVRKWSKDADFWERTEKNIKSHNSGSTIITPRQILVLVGPQDSKAELLNTLAHETRHVVDDIAPDCKTSPAQIAGEIFSTFADWL